MHKRKVKVLRIISSLNPKYGGPARATIDSSIALQKKGINVDILTCDNKKEVFFKSKKIKIINKGPGLLGAYSFSLKLFFWLKKNEVKYDAFIVHGLWQFNTLMARLLIKKKYYVLLHGQLDPFFKNDFIKLIKKKIYWFLFERNNLLNAKSILLTSKGEMQTLKNTFVKTSNIKKQVIQYGIIKPKLNKKKLSIKFYKKFKNFKDKKFYLFLGRFHEKKGCEIIIETIKILGNNFKGLVLMAGPLSNTIYEKKIINLIKEYKLEKKIIISEALYNDLKWGAIQQSKVMLLPSHGENFGVALVESLSFSKPVLTTFKVNIYKDILNYKAGLVSKDTVNGFTKILKQFSQFNNRKIKKYSNNSYICFKKNFNLESKNNELAKLLNNENYN